MHDFTHHLGCLNDMHDKSMAPSFVLVHNGLDRKDRGLIPYMRKIPFTLSPLFREMDPVL